MISSKPAKPAYAGVILEGKNIKVALQVGKKTTNHEVTEKKDLPKWFKDVEEKKDIKIVSAALKGEKGLKKIASELWLKNDIVPFIVHNSLKKKPKDLAHYASEKFVDDVVKITLGPDNKVEVTDLVTLDDYEKITPKKDFNLLLKLADKFKNKKVVFFSATPRGGGVALMRHALMRLFGLVDVDASWHVMQENPDVFEVTKKKFHNVLHGIAPPEVKLTEEDKKLYMDWIEKNSKRLHSLFHDSNVVVIDDPQPSGLVPFIKKASPKKRIIYRSHIQLETSLFDNPQNPQSLTWKFIWENIKNADCFVSHPIPEFVPREVNKEKVVFMPATTDPLDGLNKPMAKRQKDYYFSYFNQILKDIGQSPLDTERPYIIQVARFDPSKGIQDVVEAYRLLREQLSRENINPPQLVIVGHGSVDDPEGAPIFTNTLKLLRIEKYRGLASDVKVARLPHIDQILNVLLSESLIALQLSHKEGFEVKVSEALMKGVPVIAYKTGGIPLQIKDGVSGYLVSVGDTDAVAQSLYELLTDKSKYKKMSKNAIKYVRPDVSTVSNALSWLYLSNRLVDRGKIKGDMQEVYDMARKNNKNYLRRDLGANLKVK